MITKTFIKTLKKFKKGTYDDLKVEYDFDEKTLEDISLLLTIAWAFWVIIFTLFIDWCLLPFEIIVILIKYIGGKYEKFSNIKRKSR